MPRISAFYGIVVTMYSSDHAPPHFHARYGEHEAQIIIDTGDPWPVNCRSEPYGSSGSGLACIEPSYETTGSALRPAHRSLALTHCHE